MYARGEHVHASVWPTWSFERDHIRFRTRQYAYYGKCFVILSCGPLDAEVVPESWRRDTVPSEQVADGGSAIIAPDGSYVAGAVYREETTISGGIDLPRWPWPNGRSMWWATTAALTWRAFYSTPAAQLPHDAGSISAADRSACREASSTDITTKEIEETIAAGIKRAHQPWMVRGDQCSLREAPAQESQRASLAGPLGRLHCPSKGESSEWEV